MDHADAPDSALPPDRAAAGDVSTTGHSTHDVQAYDTPAAHDTHDTTDAHDAHDADDAHGGHGGHGVDDAAEKSTLVPTTWTQLILPAIILIFVALLVAGPVMNAFAPKPAAQAPEGSGEQQAAQPTATQPAATATQAPQPTATAQAVLPPSPTAGSASDYFMKIMATATAVALDGQKGDVSRAPVKLILQGSTFTIVPGSGLLPDWKPSQDDTVATWIDGTFANHVFYLPYSSRNDALFKGTKPGDAVQVQMNTGQVFVFSVTRTQRAVNGPATNPEQFTVASAMQQDHAGVTIFLAGDPAADRAVVQADFTGNIQSALP
ncbi:MAG: hypothetical protein ACJ78Q_15620 [Chloroflexia bacterium]